MDTNRFAIRKGHNERSIGVHESPTQRQLSKLSGRYFEIQQHSHQMERGKVRKSEDYLQKCNEKTA